jgi:hypothetical protein
MLCSIPAEVGKPFNMACMVAGGSGFLCMPDFDPVHISLVSQAITPIGPGVAKPVRYTFTFVPRMPGPSVVHLITLRPWVNGEVSKVTSCDILVR